MDAARELGVAFVPYPCLLGRGFLTGSFADAAKELTSDDFRLQQPRFNGENAANAPNCWSPYGRSRAASRSDVGQIALAWVQQRAQVHEGLTVVPIPGTPQAHPDRGEHRGHAHRTLRR